MEEGSQVESPEDNRFSKFVRVFHLSQFRFLSTSSSINQIHFVFRFVTISLIIATLTTSFNETNKSRINTASPDMTLIYAILRVQYQKGRYKIPIQRIQDNFQHDPIQSYKLLIIFYLNDNCWKLARRYIISSIRIIFLNIHRKNTVRHQMIKYHTKLNQFQTKNYSKKKFQLSFLG